MFLSQTIWTTYAYDAPERPERPERPSQESSETQQEQSDTTQEQEPTKSNAPEAPDAPDAPDAPERPSRPGEENTNSETPNDSATSTKAESEQSDSTPLVSATPTATASNTKTGADSNNKAASSTNSDTAAFTNNDAEINNDLLLDSSTGRNYSDKNTGNASIATGNSNVIGQIQNQANQTGTSVSGGSCNTCQGSGSASNSKTGAASDNDAQIDNNTSVYLENNQNAELDSGIIALSETGSNSASKNTGNADITTGDSNVGLTVVNVANTDITGVGTSEYNVYDDHRGDIVIDFANLSGNNQHTAQNYGTGADSTNQANANSNTTLTVVNNNDATVASELVIDADTGGNQADKNTGDATIKTGDANVVANVVNLVNNTLAAGTEVVVATVNVFGDMVGDLILTDSSQAPATSCADCNDATEQANNNKTGADSQNTATTTSGNTTNITQNNQADINNGIKVNGNTGGNYADKNTGGSNVETGEVNIQGTTTNVANNNQIGGDGGTWWMVIVNEAGNWIGHIYGHDENDNVVSGGTVDLGASNEKTGTDSTNTAKVENSNTTDITQNNNAEVGTQITVNADTGHNSAEKNSGNAEISTGDVNVSNNIVNFINNNFVGQKVVVTFVNIFGSLTGNIVTPDTDHRSVKHEDQAIEYPQGIGGHSLAGDYVDYDEQTATITPTTSGTTSKQTAGGQSAYAGYTSYQSENNKYAAVNNSNNQPIAQLASYQITAQEADRIAQGEWVVQEDTYLTVTPQPQVLGAMDTNESDPFNSLYIGIILLGLSAGFWHTRKQIKPN